MRKCWYVDTSTTTQRNSRFSRYDRLEETSISSRMAEATASAERADADDEPPALNALQENIARRGNNAYYYAHGHRNDAPAWDGDPSPMKLETTAAPPERRRCAITRYSWLDEDTKIRIYIPVDDERFQRPDAITLTWTEKSVVLAADLGDEVHTFAVPALYDTIVGASHRVKPTKIVVTLKKPPDSKFKWYDLKK